MALTNAVTEQNSTTPGRADPEVQPASASVQAGLAQKWAVVIPTTGGPVHIDGLKKRRELPFSMMTLTDDYSALDVSQTYVNFVERVLVEAISDRGPYHMSLSGPIESGRSWELPVALAHLLYDVGRLSQKKDAGVEAKSLEPARGLIWATGTVDANLTPLDGEYWISEKLNRSAELFEAAKARGQTIIIALPKGAAKSSADRAALTDAANHWGAEIAELRSDDDIYALGGRLAPGLIKKPAERLARKLRWPVAIALIFAAALALALGLADFRTATPKPTRPQIADIAVHALNAPKNETCQSAIYSQNRPLDVEPATRNGDVFVVRSGPQLCGFEFTNVSRNAMRLGIDPQLVDAAIIADGEIFQATGQALAPSWQTRILLRQALPDRDIAIWFGEAEKRRMTLRLASMHEDRP